MTTITVPEGYGNVIAVALGLMPILSFAHGAVVTKIRKAANIAYPNTYATAQECKESVSRAPPYILCTLLSTTLLTPGPQREAEKFNCAQRAHANLLENMPQTIISTLVAGLAYPSGATAAGFLWVVARIMFLQGYVWSGKPRGAGRYRGSWFMLCQAAIWAMDNASDQLHPQPTLARADIRDKANRRKAKKIMGPASDTSSYTYLVSNIVTDAKTLGLLSIISLLLIYRIAKRAMSPPKASSSASAAATKDDMGSGLLTHRPPLTARERLDMLPAILSVTASGARSTFTGLHRKDKHAKTHGLHVRYAIMRKATARMTAKQLRQIMPASNKVYDSYMKRKGKKPDTVNLGENALGHWIGDKNAENILIFFHGGGYALPATEGYFQFYTKLIEDMRKEGRSLCVFALTYTLAPDAQYPVQIKQAAACLRYILELKTWDEDRIFIAGDSAGGNLTCALLSHIAHPHPQVQPLEVSGLGGALLLSPWTYLQSDTQGHVIDSSGDLVSEHVNGPWSSGYLGDAPNDNYTDASTAPGEWFVSYPVQRIFVSAGGNEILLPAIDMLVQSLKSGFPGHIEYVVGKREAHVAPIYDPFLGCKQESEQTKGLKKWLKESLYSSAPSSP
ncbi:orotidine 5'-phosphate decarboxylase [Ascosphaera pollenicola]|nr:orotidine 5'-phosphate decarboxylase [Ascosphaera pollenicola]